MHTFAVVLIPESLSTREEILDYIEERIAPHKHYFYIGMERTCECVRENGGVAKKTCNFCGGKGITRYNPNGRLDYWILGGRFNKYVHLLRYEPDTSFDIFMVELARSFASSAGRVFHYGEHDSIEDNIGSKQNIHPEAITFEYVDTDGKWVESHHPVNLAHLLEKYPGYCAAGIDYHS